MKKRSKIVSLGVLALTLTMMSTCLMGATMARYVTEVKGSATAKVAAWSFKASLGDTNTTAVDLSSTGSWNNVGEGVIAPGTSGSFEIVIDGTGSDVGIEYSIALAAAPGISLPEDLMFSTEAISMNNAGQKLEDFEIPTDEIDYNAGDMIKKIPVYWSWSFGENDTAEENKNDNGYQDEAWTLNITVTGKQVQPTSTNQ